MMGEKCEAEDLLELLSCAVTRTCLVMAFQNYECFSKKDNIIKNWVIHSNIFDFPPPNW